MVIIDIYLQQKIPTIGVIYQIYRSNMMMKRLTTDTDTPFSWSLFDYVFQKLDLNIFIENK